MSRLDELLDQFRNDSHWNSEESNGSHRFDKEIAWIETMIKDYSEKLQLPIDRVVELMEQERDYSWPNYYQECNFPPIDSAKIIGIFETYSAFRSYAKENYQGFRCGHCGNIGRHPQECDHRIAKDGICDWCSYGLFKSGIFVVIHESGVKPIPIFEPAKKETAPAGAVTPDERM